MFGMFAPLSPDMEKLALDAMEASMALTSIRYSPAERVVFRIKTLGDFLKRVDEDIKALDPMSDDKEITDRLANLFEAKGRISEAISQYTVLRGEIWARASAAQPPPGGDKGKGREIDPAAAQAEADAFDAYIEKKMNQIESPRDRHYVDTLEYRGVITRPKHMPVLEDMLESMKAQRIAREKAQADARREAARREAASRPGGDSEDDDDGSTTPTGEKMGRPPSFGLPSREEMFAKIMKITERPLSEFT
ncbi:hypothetical protein DFP72DRAFT_890031 [Ephemerocybe angulata]|uniref:Uncharacterized protein n=1 Tax=Ephemerocybe angulata TaxID=980116 RepID=A0A8H6I3P5_9AGAR|nr:hypothetical protein DFP72DRAFT_890031 [Tulosesus angulatus]